MVSTYLMLVRFATDKARLAPYKHPVSLLEDNLPLKNYYSE